MIISAAEQLPSTCIRTFYEDNKIKCLLHFTRNEDENQVIHRWMKQQTLIKN